MAKKIKPEIVQCRYPQCKRLHESNKLLKDEAVQHSEKGYYHKDCYHIMKTIIYIRDTFVEKINPLMTSKQIGTLVSTINHIIFDKHVDVDFLKFALDYFIQNKPGSLNYPAGLHYIVQNNEVSEAWRKLQDAEIMKKIRDQQKKQEDEIDVNDFGSDIPDSSFTYKGNKPKISKILGV